MPRHGHSLSVSNTPAIPAYNPAAAFNPFGPQATLGSDQIFSRTLNTERPRSKSPNSVGDPSSRPRSRPDFTRGFGLDIPEEEEPPEEADADNEEGADQGSDMDLVDGDAEVGAEAEDDGMAMLNRIHSRHVSRLSAALSLRSVGRQEDPLPNTRDLIGNPIIDDLDLIEKEVDGVAEWTGSEDQRGDSDEVSAFVSFSAHGVSHNSQGEHRGAVQPIRRRTYKARAKAEADRAPHTEHIAGCSPQITQLPTTSSNLIHSIIRSKGR